MENILDFSIENDERMMLFETYCENNKNDENISFELTNRLIGIYQFSGMKILQDFLYNICYNPNITSILKFTVSQGMLLFDELEEEIAKGDKDDIIKIKNESNSNIRDRNDKRRKVAYEAINNVCLTSIDDLPTPCRIDSVLNLMDAGDTYKEECNI